MDFRKSQLAKTIAVLRQKDCPDCPEPQNGRLKKTLSRVRGKK